ncbi:MAG: cell division protein FtsW [Gemmatimonadetes bacterium]|nr:cell division protein FtsW [Gemmatimonadota bacterium]MBK6778778.1 cell division protein FtsW [Gemmatimonadota bacterium]MBP9201844.1 cell division protein FtsW [Gemmatimonadales bacterium]
MSSPVVRHPGELRWETRLLAVVTATLVALGIATVYGASSLVRSANGIAGGSYALTQFTGALVGGILMLVLGRIDYRLLRPLAWPLLLGSLLALVIVVLPFTPSFIAPRYNGARRWLRLGPLQFQVSELVRLVVIIWCAMLATKKGDQVRQFKKGMLPFLFILGVASALIMLQPNMSMAVLIALLGGIVLFSAGAKIGHFLLLGLGAVIAGLQLIQRAGYRAERWDKFINGAEGTSQIYQSLVGIGSGRLFGVGFGMGQQKMGYVPYAYSDFIFSAIAEEWGFVGVCLLVLLFGIFVWLGLRIARTAADPFGQFLAVGLTAMVGVTALMHMAVNLSLMPTTGLTLPFVSYGRTSLVVSLAGVGILLSIGRLRGKPAGRGPTTTAQRSPR